MSEHPAQLRHTERGRGEEGRVREGDAERSLEPTPFCIAASSSPSVMMAASKYCMHVCVCVCVTEQEQERRERAALVFIGD